EFLKNHTWTGNIRELENLVERLVTLTSQDTKIMDPRILPSEFHDEWKSTHTLDPVIETPKLLREAVAEYEKTAIENALAFCEWNQSKAARMLGISEHAIRYKIKNLGIVRQNDRRLRG
ncbi:MAG: hypothetical protein KAT15_32185, partial [Bacteroidales bacterium]|nr:hypothetical protein [Bacteroidales bacterium]